MLVHQLSVPVTPCNTRITYYRDHLLLGPLITGTTYYRDHRNWDLLTGTGITGTSIRPQEPAPLAGTIGTGITGTGTTGTGIADEPDLLQVDQKERILLLDYLYQPCNGSIDSDSSRPLPLGNINI